MSLSLELASHLFSFLGHEGAPALLALHDSEAELRLRFRPSINDLFEVCRTACVDVDSGIPDVLSLLAHYKQYILIDYLLHCHKAVSLESFFHSSQALTIAASRGDVYLLRILLDDDRLRPSPETLLSAVDAGHVRSTRALFESEKVSRTMCLTTLCMAWTHRKTRLAVMRMVCKQKITVSAPAVTHAFESGLTGGSMRGVVPLMFGIVRGMGVVEMMVRICIEHDRLDIAVRVIDRASGEFSQELLEHAAEEGALGVVKRLLARGLDPKAHNGATMRAAISGNATKVIRYLLRADAFTDDSMDLALMHACFTGDVGIVRVALKRADCHPHAEIFVYACRMRRLEIVKLLVNDPRVNPRVGSPSGAGIESDAGIITAFRNADKCLAEFLMAHPRTTLKCGSASWGLAWASVPPDMAYLLETTKLTYR